MPAPGAYTYATAVLTAAQTAVLDEIDADASAGSIKLYDESDTLLAEIPLTDPAGTVTSGVLTVTASGPDTSANATGTCSYGTICDGAGTVICTIPAQAGSVAVSGKIVINSTSIISGGEVSLVSCTIG